MTPARSPFLPKEAFFPKEQEYQILPFRFKRWKENEVLLVNDVGEHCIVSAEIFHSLVHHRLDPESVTFENLQSRLFISRGDPRWALDLLATRYRTKKSFLEGFTRLHLFVVTLRCDHTCRYCQVSRVTADRTRFDMPWDVAQRAIDLVFKSPAPEFKIEFQGGESLLAWDLIRRIVEEVEGRAEVEGRRVDFVVATNLVPLDDSMLEFMREHRIQLSTSLDGPALIHDRNRPRPSMNSHALFLDRLEKAREVLGHDQVSAVMTTTEHSLGHPEDIVDEFVHLGFDSIFLRPISPYGFAVRTGEAERYAADEFLAFYRRGLARILEHCRQGVDLVEVYSQILLTQMFTPFPTGYVDLQSPAGTGFGAVAYNYDGEVYVSDEARMLAAMGDRSFRMGHVEDTWEELFGGELMQALAMSSVLETLPGCSDCAFLPWCGADPLFHYRTQGDPIGHRPTSGFCRKNMGIFEHLLELWHHGDSEVQEILLRWATCVQPEAPELELPQRAVESPPESLGSFAGIPE